MQKMEPSIYIEVVVKDLLQVKLRLLPLAFIFDFFFTTFYYRADTLCVSTFSAAGYH